MRHPAIRKLEWTVAGLPGNLLRVHVRRASDADADRCVDVLRQLPDYFTPDTYEEVANGVRADVAWVAEDGGRVIGCLVLQQRYELSAEITFAAVDPKVRQQGIGKAMTAQAIKHARLVGLRAIEVKTLDESAGYEPYVATRAFWERMGFVQIDCIDPLPGWQPGNPSAIYILPLA